MRNAPSRESHILTLTFFLCSGCGTIVQSQHLEVVDVQRHREALDPETTLEATTIAADGDHLSMTIETTSQCRTALVSVEQRELVTTRKVQRSWNYPAPISGQTTAGEALLIALYATIISVIDNARGSESREPAAPERRVDGIEMRQCGTAPLARTAVELAVAYYLPTIGFGPEFSWTVLGPSRRTAMTTARTDARGHASVRLPDAPAPIPTPTIIVRAN